MGYYHRVQHSPIIAATNGDTERYVQARGTVVRAQSVARQTDYPTAKPAELARQLLAEPVLERDERLIEPFCGTAPGGAAHDGPYWGADIRGEAVGRARENIVQRSLPWAATGGEGERG